jgi:hypothetical protein
MSVARRWIRSPASCAPLIRASSIRRIARRRPFRTAGASPGAPVRPASRRATQGSISLSSETQRSPPSMSSSIRRLYDGGYRCRYSSRPFRQLVWRVRRPRRSQKHLHIALALAGMCLAWRRSAHDSVRSSSQST